MRLNILTAISLTLFVWVCSLPLWAQPAGWQFAKKIYIQERSGTALSDYQMPIVINTEVPISAGQMQPNGEDIRFGLDANGNTLLNYWIESGLNTANTVVWVKVPALPANASTPIYMFYGNSGATGVSNIDGTFVGPHSSTDSVASGSSGGQTNSQRGFRFAPKEDILVKRFGKREPNGTTRYVTLFDFASQAILRQHQVDGPAGNYSYADLSTPIWLTQGTQYLLELYQGSTDGYYFGPSSQIGQHLTYFDMRYCGSCNQNTFPILTLNDHHYGYPDFHYYTKNTANPAPIYDVCPLGNVIYVNAAATGGNDGSSWTDAFTDLQSALNSTCPGITEIWVAAGTYKPTTGTNRSISFSMKNGVGIYGGFPGIPGQEGNFSVRDWAANPTILSGDIDGVPDVITGSGSTLSITGNGGNSFHVILNDNNGLTTTNSLLDGFTITGGNANDSGIGVNTSGGGMFNRNASPSLKNLTFFGNNALTFGGGIYNETSSPNLTNVTFLGNSASSNGGAAGGGMANLSSYPNLTNVIFYGNNSSHFGGGMININARSPVILTNVTFAGNNAGNDGGAIFNSFASAIIKNSIFWKNTISNNANTVGADISNNGGNSVFPTSATVSNTALQFAISAYTYNFPNIETNSNLFTQDPLFVNTAAGNLRLQACSPAIDAGSNAAVPSGITTDLDGNPRFFNSGTVDIGAYESQTGFPGNPAQFGSNAWHVYVWKSGNASIPNNAAWNENYAGYYVDNNLNINTPDRWPASGSPSQASGYTGCAVENDFFSFSCKRKGFPPGSYLLNVPNHDDAADLWVNGSKVWEHNACCDAHANVWSGNLGATDFVEFRVTEGNGGSIGILDFAICPSNGIAYVNAAATGANNGTSWADAYTDLQSALNSSCPGITEIWVAAGTYKPTTGTNRGISFSMKNGVGIYGGFAGTDTLREQRNWTTNATILSGDIGIAGDNSDNTHHVIRNSGLNNSSILDGFTISGGRTPESFSYDGRGGGMYNDGASPMIRNCIFTGNVARTFGGGMENIYSNPIVTNCVFTGNSAGGNGTGMHNDSGSPTLINCTMSNNLGYGAIATNSPGAVATLTNCIVMGGIYETNGGSATVRYCISEDPFNGIGNLGADPLFVDAANGDFRLQACSPAIDAGTDTGVPTTDFDGNARVDAISGGSVTDIGAYEYQSTAPVPTALCKTFTAYLGANGTAVMVSASDINNGSGDNTCGPVTLSINGQTSVTYTCSDLGQRTATLTVASAKSNRSATCQTTVTVADNTKPTITCPANTTLALGGNCSASLPAYALATKSDNCAASGSIGELQSPEAGTPFSGHNTAQTVVLTANDGNGNTKTCQFTVTLLDNTKPTITCPANTTIILDGNCSASLPAYALATKSDNCAASGSIGEWQSPEAGTPLSGHNTTQTVVLTANDGNGNTETCQFTVTLLDNTVPSVTCKPASLSIIGTGTATLTPEAVFLSGSDNCGPVTLVSVSPNSFGTNQLGQQTVVLTVRDAANNTATCTAEVQVSRNVSGRIIWKQDQSTGVKDATVTLNGSQSGNMTTAANGNYGFTLANGSNFTITPSKNLNKMNGINAQDVQRIQQHLSGNPIVNPWQMLAADVNASNSITALDVNILQLAILGNPSALSQMPKSWRFVPAGYALSNPPWGCPEQMDVNPSTANFDFYGVKVGDMVATYANPANASAQPLLLTAQDQLLEAGQVLTIDLHTGALRDLNALQFALHFDPEQLQLSGVESLDALPLTSEHLGTWQAAEGSLRILWSDVKSRGLAAGAPLLRLRFAVVEGGARLSEVLQLDEAALPGLVFTGAGASAGVTLRYDAATATQQPVVVGLALQNYPNPFTGHTTVRFELPEACEAQLRITDATGRLIAEHGATYGAGRHEWRFDRPVSAGVLYCELKTPFGALTQKMIAVE